MGLEERQNSLHLKPCVILTSMTITNQQDLTGAEKNLRPSNEELTDRLQDVPLSERKNFLDRLKANSEIPESLYWSEIGKVDAELRDTAQDNESWTMRAFPFLSDYLHDSGKSPVVANWKTSIGFSLLGLLVGMPLLSLVLLLMALLIAFLLSFPFFALGVPYEMGGRFSALVAFLIFFTLVIIYPMIIYPSYFSEKPLLKSSRAISFANLMFGGLIFGCLWNSNLTNKTKGISHVVFVVINGLFASIYVSTFL